MQFGDLISAGLPIIMQTQLCTLVGVETVPREIVKKGIVKSVVQKEVKGRKKGGMERGRCKEYGSCFLTSPAEKAHPPDTLSRT